MERVQTLGPHKVDDIGFEPLQAALAARLDVLRPAVRRRPHVAEKPQPPEPPPVNFSRSAFNFSCSACHSMEPGAHVGCTD